MNDTKHPLKSLGILAPSLALIVFIVNQIHPGLGLTTEELSPAIDGIDTVLGLAFAIIGRWRATKQISLSVLLLIAALPLALAACGLTAQQIQTDIATGIQAACTDVNTAAKLNPASPVLSYAQASCGSAESMAALEQSSATVQWLGQIKAQLEVAPAAKPAA